MLYSPHVVSESQALQGDILQAIQNCSTGCMPALNFFFDGSEALMQPHPRA